MRLERPAVRRQTAPRAPKLIAVVAPANTMKHIDPRLVELGRRALEELGFVVQFGAHVLSEGKFGVAPLPERLADMQWAMSDPAIDLVMPAYGGYNSNQLLPYLDYNLARQTQKTYIGFSDLSALLIALGELSGCRVLHGPAFVNFCDPGLLPYCRDGLLRVLAGDAVTYEAPEMVASDEWYLKKGWGPRELKRGSSWTVYREGQAEGPLVGGNLETLCCLTGTPFFPNLRGSILFLEDAAGDRPASFLRDLTHLTQVPEFFEIRGLLIGSFPDGSKLADHGTLVSILDELLGHSKFPVLCGVSCSHVDPMMTLPLFERITLHAEENPKLVLPGRKNVHCHDSRNQLMG